MESEIDVPPFFICPISLQIMKDPVTVSTGITYDRESIEKWVFTNENNNCPVTKQPLTNTDFLTPNHTLRRLIQSWCTLNASHGIERFPTPKPPASKAQILKLIDGATKRPQSRTTCLKKLKSIATESSANKRCLESAGAVEFLSKLIILKEEPRERNWDEIEEALSLVSLLQISEDQLKKMLKERDGLPVVDTLARAMQQGSYEARASAIELMKSLMHVLEPVQAAALRQNHFVEVVQLLRDPVSPKATRSALKVLTLACPWGRNRVRVVEAGAVPVLVDLLLDAAPEDRRLSEMALVVLDHLCGCAEGRAKLVGHGAGLAVVSKRILRVSHVATERGVRILSSVLRFSGSGTVVQEMAQLGVVTKLCLVLQVDCEAKTKERAKEMLKLHARTWRNSPCVPSRVLDSL